MIFSAQVCAVYFRAGKCNIVGLIAVARNHSVFSLAPPLVGRMEFEEHNDYDYLLKVILIGDSGVGKSCLLKSYMTHRWDEIYTSTIGVDFEIKCVELLGHKVNLQIWDTAGQERFRTITTSYYRVSDVVVMVFDLADSRSFENVKNWMADVKTYAHESVDIMVFNMVYSCI